MKRITIVLDDATYGFLDQKRRETGATMSGQIRVAIGRWLEENESVTKADIEEEF